MCESESNCQGCDLVADAATLGIQVHGRGWEVLEDGCGLSEAQKKMLAARIDDHRTALEIAGRGQLQ